MRPVTDFYKPDIAHLSKELENIATTGLGGDVIFGHDGLANCLKGYWLLDQTPNPGTDDIEAVVNAGFDIKDHGLAAHIARDLIR